MKRLIEALRQIHFEATGAVGYAIMVEGATPWKARAAKWWWIATDFYRWARCEMFGHDIVSMGADPENGSEDLACRRCGWSTRVYMTG